MNRKRDVDSLVERALYFKNKEQYKKSNDIIKGIILDFPSYSKIPSLKVVLSGNYYNLKEYKKSIYYAKEVVTKSTKSELSSLLMYLSYIELNQHKKAFETLFSYLENHPANLFKDTLEELLEGLSEGYGLNYKDKIIYFADKNNIKQ